MSGSFTSRESYAPPLTQPAERGPDPRATTQVSGALAAGFADVAGQYMRLWAAAGQAQDVNEATSRVARLSMDLADMQRGFDTDPDPATAPQRFRERSAEWRAQALEGLSGGVARHVERQLDQLIPNAYRQVAAGAHQRHITALRGTLADTLGTHAQGMAGAADEPSLLAQVQGAKQAIAGNVQAGVIAEAQARPLFSAAVRQAITIRAATDPIAAQQLLERFKGEMDAADVAALTTSLRAPLERSRAEAAASAVMGGRGAASDIYQAIQMQESGGRDGQVSVDGARGRMQIMPGTWAQYARPGENIDNPADNEAVGRRIIDDLSAKAGGDPARIAVGYFSGPGNIAPPGSPTPWKEDRRDGNGMSVSRYVAQVMNRLTPPSAERSEGQKATLLADVRDRLKDEPLHVQLQGQALVAQMLNNEQAGQEQARAVLGRELRDLEASYQGGNTGPGIPEDRIRQLLPPDQAQRTIDSLTLARTAGDAVKASAYASQADQAAVRATIAGDPSNPYMAAERRQALALFDQARQRIQTALKDDPGGYAMTAPEVQQLAAAGGTPQQLIAAGMAVQARMGVLPSARRLLTNDQASQMAELLRTTGPDKADMGATLAGLARTFGADDPDPAQRATGAALFNAALGELVKQQRIGWEWIAFAGMDRPEQAQGRALLQQALVFEAQRGGAEAMVKAMPEGENRNLRSEIDSALTELRTVTSHHPGGLAMFDSVRRSVETIARMRVIRGESASQAAKNAYNDVIGHKWEPAGDDGSGWIFDSPTLLVPKGQAGRIETALAQVRSAVQPADILPLRDPLRPSAQDAELREATASAARRGHWINNADASGAVLVGRTAGGGLVNILRPDGRPIEVLFEHLPRAAEALAAGLPAAAANQPADAGTATATTMRQRFLRAMSHPSFDPYTTVLDAVVDFVLPQTMPPGVTQNSDMPPSTVTLPDRPAERLPMFRPIPSWSERAQQRYGRRPGVPMEGDR